MRSKKLLENLEMKSSNKVEVRRYNLSEMISESYKSYYRCEKNTNLQKLAEAHLDDVRKNPTDTDRLSRQLCNLNHMIEMVESKKMKDEELLVPEEKYTPVEPEEKVEESKEALKESGDEKMTPDEMKEYWEKNKTKDPILANYKSYDEWYKDSKENGYVKDEEDNLLEDTELTDEEIEELTKYLGEMRKNKKVTESSEKFVYHVDFDDGNSMPFDDEKKAIDYAKQKRASSVAKTPVKVASNTGEEHLDGDNEEIIWTRNNESKKTYESINLSEFSKKSAGKAFVRTFKKLDSKLREGTALTRQEAISLYKAANSAMTQLSVELEHNPEFLDTFKESVSLLSKDASRLLESLKEGKAPSKANMKSLAKFSEALLREAEKDEEIPPVEDEEEDVIAEESEEFDQEYADARIELHNELAEEHADSEDPEVQDKLAQDAEEVANLPGVSEEQAAELLGDESDASEEEEESEEGDVESEEGSPDDEDILESEITDDELAELKKHLTEMRKSKKVDETTKKVLEGRKLKRKK